MFGDAEHLASCEVHAAGTIIRDRALDRSPGSSQASSIGLVAGWKASAWGSGCDLSTTGTVPGSWLVHGEVEHLLQSFPESSG